MIRHASIIGAAQKMLKAAIAGVGVAALLTTTSVTSQAMSPGLCAPPAASLVEDDHSDLNAPGGQLLSVWYRYGYHYRYAYRWHPHYYVRRGPVYVGGGGGGGCCPNSMLVCPLGRHFC